jgi:dihydroorotate dehydrogenase (NAD+) catalytic subunit
VRSTEVREAHSHSESKRNAQSAEGDEPMEKKKTGQGILQQTVCGMIFQNPIIAASGTFGYGDEFKDIIDVNSLGGIVLKGLTLEPREGNPVTRLMETPSGMLNSVGLQNIGVERFIREKGPYLKSLKSVVIANVAGGSVEENVGIFQKLEALEAIGCYELNVSCPNVKHGGMMFGSDPDLLREVVSAVRRITARKIIVKLSPNVTDIAEMARVAEGEGADMISAINTLLGMAISIKDRKPVLANITGGLSGPAIKPVGLRAVWQIASVVKIPVIGMGGIMDHKDVLEYILAGASLVQVGTANFVKTDISSSLIKDLKAWCQKEGVQSISSLVGAARGVYQ